MNIVINDYIPAKGFKAITIWPFIFSRCALDADDVRHELIHGKQQLEMLPFGFWFGFLLLYGLMWLVELVRCKRDPLRGAGYGLMKPRPLWKRAYKMIPYEREAHYGEQVEGYPKKRKLFAFIHFIKN